MTAFGWFFIAVVAVVAALTVGVCVAGGRWTDRWWR